MEMDILKPSCQDHGIPSLGSGFDSVSGKFLSTVIEGACEYAGTHQGEWKLETNMSSAKKASIIRGSANIEINYAIFSGSGGMSLDLVKKKNTRSYSETMLFEVFGKTRKFTRPKFTDHAQSAVKKSTSNKVFGDSFVNSVTPGGRLFLDLEISFDEDTDLTKVRGNIAIDIAKLIKGSAEASVELDEATRKAKIVVRAKQIGGDATKLANIFGNGSNIMECSGGNYEACKGVFEDVTNYAKAFGEQLQGLEFDPNNYKGPGILGYTTAKYEEWNLDPFSSTHPIVNRENARLREALTHQYFRLVEDIKFIEQKLSAGFDNEEFRDGKESIKNNIRNLVKVINESDEYPDRTSDLFKQYEIDFCAYKDPAEVETVRHGDKEMLRLISASRDET